MIIFLNSSAHDSASLERFTNTVLGIGGKKCRLVTVLPPPEYGSGQGYTVVVDAPESAAMRLGRRA